METQMISMDPAKAKAAFQNYRVALKHKHTKEDEILMRGYKHLAKGKQILDLIDVMKKVGVDSRDRPRLAIARANWEKCWFYGSSNGSGIFSQDRWTRANWTSRKVEVPAETFPRHSESVYQISARVPAIPPQFKPHGSLDRYHILWDATWEPEPPRDPILLRHLGRNVYAVLAVWDLTDLERALMR